MDKTYKSTKSVAVLMATYNGGAYLTELLTSLQAQTFSDWQLFVQDDLSTDGTVGLLQEFAKNDSRIVLVENHVKHGAMGNFMALLEKVESPYYMFCDQDDVWLPKKIETTLNRMKEVECAHVDTPVIVHTDLKVVDENLKEISSSFWKMSRIDPNLLRTFSQLGGRFLATGCTMMINAAAKKVSFPINKGALMHDMWVTMRVAQVGGIITEVPQSTILYRQHGDNTIGARDLRRNFIVNKLFALGRVFIENKKVYHMLDCMGYGSCLKFLYYKLRYHILYKK